MIQLYYTPSTGSLSSSLQVIADNQTPLYYTSVTISSSSVSIFVQSGSTSLATYPISNTTLYYPPFPTIGQPLTLTTSSYITVDYQFILSYVNGTNTNLSGSGYLLSSGSTVYISSSYYSNAGRTIIEVPTVNLYNFTANVYGNTAAGGTYQSALFVTSNQGVPPTNIVALVTGSNISSSATFSLSPTASYTMYFIITGSGGPL